MTEPLRVRAEDTSVEAPHRALAIGGVRVRLAHQIGVGRFSVVFKGRDEWGNELAAKVYREQAPIAMWRNEVEQLRRFRHPHVVDLRGGFELEGRRYLVMRNGGVALGRVTLGGEAPGREKFMVACARGLLQALHLIHSRGYVHGDVNPQNCLVETRGKSVHLRLADFGLCRRPKQSRELTKFSLWMPAPEEVQGGPDPVLAATDVYRAALVLWRLLSKEPIEAAGTNCHELRIRAEQSESALVRALAPALALNPAERPTAVALWRMLHPV